jgi:hypothetical protein
VAIAERTPSGSFDAWVARFPPGQGLPGDDPGRGSPFSVTAYLRQAMALVIELLRSAPVAPPAQDAATTPEAWVDAVDTVLKYGRLATSAALFEATDLLRVAMDSIRRSLRIGVMGDTAGPSPLAPLRLFDPMEAEGGSAVARPGQRFVSTGYRILRTPRRTARWPNDQGGKTL